MGTGVAGIVPGGSGGISPRALAKMKRDPVVPCILYDGSIVNNQTSGVNTTVAVLIDFTQLKQVKFYSRYFVDSGSYSTKTRPWWIGDDQTANNDTLASGSTKVYNERYASTSHSDALVTVDVSSITGKHYLCVQMDFAHSNCYIDYLKLIYKDV